ncbi:MAG: ComEC/Rec2 family competence protein, partial [Actinomycetes bacterium]
MWALSAAAPLLSPAELWLGAGAATGMAVAVAHGWRGPPATIATAVLAALAVASVGSALRGAALQASPLRPLADTRSTVQLVLELEDHPHLLSGPGPPRVVADATVTALTVEHDRHRLDAGVLLFAPAEGWRTLQPRQPVEVRAQLSPARPGDDAVAVVSVRGPPTALGAPGLPFRAAGALREGLAASAGRVLDPRAAGLLPGLVVGDTLAMDPVLDEDFRRAGLSHLTAVSGANVAIVLTAALWPLRRRAVDRR